jgi:peptide methionine sulfoxide reductase MsrA
MAPCARFGAVKGVIRVRVGYTGGTQQEPSYNDP